MRWKDFLTTEYKTEIYSSFTKAIQALKQGNPFLYSPGFLDRENVWKLDKNLK